MIELDRKATDFFFHPDYTVGTGVTPVRRIALADFTAGRESHPALKNIPVCATIIIARYCIERKP